MKYVLRPALSLGLVFVLLGLIVLGFGSVTYSHAEAVVGVHRVEGVGERPGTLPLPPELGMLVLVGGVALLATASRRPVDGPPHNT